jgi:hypothetical protein
MAHQNECLKAIYIATLLLPLVWLTMPGGARAQEKPSSSLRVAYSNTALGFRYKLPVGMNDRTQSGKAEIQAGAAENHIKDTFELLLGMTSGPDDADRTWRSLAIETYPRVKFGGLDDIGAEAKMSAWVIGISSPPGTPRSLVLAGQSFAVSIFSEQDGAIKRGAVVWTTIRKDKLLSFAFVANSPEQLKKVTESMKSVQFF